MTARKPVLTRQRRSLRRSDGDRSGAFWIAVDSNLRAGRVRLVFVSDEIPPELRRIIEFLNGQMTPAEVIGIEMKQYVGEGMRTLVRASSGQLLAHPVRLGANGPGGPARGSQGIRVDRC